VTGKFDRPPDAVELDRSGVYSISTVLGPRFARAESTPGVVWRASSIRVTQDEQCMFRIGRLTVAAAAE